MTQALDQPPPRLLLIGPTMLCTDATPRPIARKQVRLLAGALGAQPDQAVPTDQLIEVLWGERLPADPRAALAVVGSRLRTELATFRDRLTTDATGWSLDIDTDIGEFLDLTSSSSHEPDTVGDATDTRRDALDRALQLWRGDPIAELIDDANFSAVARQLDDRRCAATIELAAYLVDDGDSARAVELLSPLFAERTTDEPLGAALAHALASTGRRADALDAIGSVRSALSELGLDPSPSTLQLELDILRNSVEVNPAVAAMSADTGNREPDDDGKFVGRRKELEELAHLKPGITLIVAEAGGGKSALLDQASRAFRHAEHRVVRARAPEYPERPAEVVTQLVEQFVADSPPDLDDPEQCAVLARLIPSLVSSGTRLTAVGRDALVTGLADYLRVHCRKSDAVFVVDDVHWIDAVSAEVLAQLDDVFVVGATRPVTTPAAGVVLQHACRQIELAPLTPKEILQLLEVSGVGGTLQAHARKIAERSGGNALFASLLIGLIIEGVHATALPANLLLAVHHRLDELSQRARRTLCAASVFGVAVPLRGVEALAPTAGADLADAAEIGLVTRTGDEVQFVHQLVHEVVASLLGEGERVTYHEQAAEYLEGNGGSPVEIAHHFAGAASLDPLRAARAHLAAAHAAAEAFDWELVAVHASAGETLARDLDPVLAATCVVWIGRAQRVLHRNDVDVETLLSAAIAAKQVGQDTLFAEAIVSATVCAWELDERVVAPQLRELHGEALQLTLPPALAAELRAVACTFINTDAHAQSRALYHEALSLALHLDDPTDQAAVLRYAKWGLGHPDDLAALGETSLLLSSIAGNDLDLFWTGATSRFAYGVMAGDRNAIDNAVSDLRGRQRADPRPIHRWDLAQIETAYALIDNEVELADAWLTRMFELASPQLSESWAASIYGVMLAAVRRAQGRTAELLPVIDLALERFARVPGWRAAAAGAAAAAGQKRRARAELRRLQQPGCGPFENLTWSAALVMMADAAVAVGDRSTAVDLIDRLAPYADRMAWTGVCSIGLIADSLADLALVVGDEPAATQFRSMGADLRLRLGRLPDSPPVAPVS